MSPHHPQPATSAKQQGAQIEPCWPKPHLSQRLSWRLEKEHVKGELKNGFWFTCWFLSETTKRVPSHKPSRHSPLVHRFCFPVQCGWCTCNMGCVFCHQKLPPQKKKDPLGGRRLFHFPFQGVLKKGEAPVLARGMRSLPLTPRIGGSSHLLQTYSPCYPQKVETRCVFLRGKFPACKTLADELAHGHAGGQGPNRGLRGAHVL